MTPQKQPIWKELGLRPFDHQPELVCPECYINHCRHCKCSACSTSKKQEEKPRGWHSEHSMDTGFADLGGRAITNIEKKSGDLYFIKPEGMWKLTKHGVRKVRKLKRPIFQEQEK